VGSLITRLWGWAVISQRVIGDRGSIPRGFYIFTLIFCVWICIYCIFLPCDSISFRDLSQFLIYNHPCFMFPHLLSKQIHMHTPHGLVFGFTKSTRKRGNSETFWKFGTRVTVQIHWVEESWERESCNLFSQVTVWSLCVFVVLIYLSRKFWEDC